MAIAMQNRQPGSPHERRQTIEWPGAVTSLINTTFEDGDLEEVFTAIIQNSGAASGPPVDAVLQIIAIVLEPEVCTVNNAASGHNSEDYHEDPYALVSRHASQKALAILRSWIHQGSASRILDALPNRSRLTEEDQKRPRCSFIDEEDDQLLPIQRLARRIALCPDVWQLLQINIAEEHADRTSSRMHRDSSSLSRLSDQAWNLLGLLSEAWVQQETEIVDKKTSDSATSGYSESLLSQFKRPMLGDTPTDFKASLYILLLPFQDGELEHVQRYEHCETAFRIISSLVTLASKLKIDKSAFHDSLGEALDQLPLTEFREFITACIPDRPSAKVDFLNAYLSKHAAPSTFSIPTPKDGSQPFSPLRLSTSSSQNRASPSKSSQISVAKASSATSSKARSTSTADVISIGSSDDTDDSDVVCITPVLKTSPVKPRAVPLASPAGKQKNLLSPTSSQQDIKPDIATLADPMLLSPVDVVNRLARQVPRELVNLSSDAPKYRVPRRVAASTNSNPSGATSSMRNAEIRFSTVKFELCRVYIAHAILQNAQTQVEEWKKVCPGAFLQKAIRSARHLFKSDSGDLHEMLEKWQKREETMASTLV